jgi:3-methyladenine DNA glycosylase AlkD
MLVLSHFVINKTVEIDRYTEWTSSKSKRKRRAVPVTFCEAVKSEEEPVQYFSIIEPIMLDQEDDVQKGIGTFMRESWKNSPEATED